MKREYFRSRDVLLCAAFGLSKGHQRWSDNQTLETNPHTLAFLHGGFHGPIHDWKVSSTGSDDILAVSAVLTLATGLFTAVKAYASIQRFLQIWSRAGGHRSRSTSSLADVLPNLPCGQRMSNNKTRSGVAWERLNFCWQDCGLISVGLYPQI